MLNDAKLADCALTPARKKLFRLRGFRLHHNDRRDTNVNTEEGAVTHLPGETCQLDGGVLHCNRLLLCSPPVRPNE